MVSGGDEDKVWVNEVRRAAFHHIYVIHVEKTHQGSSNNSLLSVNVKYIKLQTQFLSLHQRKNNKLQPNLIALWVVVKLDYSAGRKLLQFIFFQAKFSQAIVCIIYDDRGPIWIQAKPSNGAVNLFRRPSLVLM